MALVPRALAPVARLMPFLAPLHTSAALRAPSAATASAAIGQLQGQLGLSGPEVQALVEAVPDLAAQKPSVLQERLEMLTCGLGVSPARLRAMIVQKPQLLGDLSMRELRSMMGLSG
ncbi:hypothetical protein ABPG77_009585 [Micractinium sp. CCAP 211/92]